MSRDPQTYQDGQQQAIKLLDTAPGGRRSTAQRVGDIRLFLYSRVLEVREQRELLECSLKYTYRTIARSAARELVRCGYATTVPHAYQLVAELGARKQHDYGPQNILSFGHVGLIVRMNDKLTRIENLLARADTASNEPLEDSFVDLVGYSLIGMQLILGVFELPLADDVEVDVSRLVPTAVIPPFSAEPSEVKLEDGTPIIQVPLRDEYPAEVPVPGIENAAQLTIDGAIRQLVHDEVMANTTPLAEAIINHLEPAVRDEVRRQVDIDMANSAASARANLPA